MPTPPTRPVITPPNPVYGSASLPNAFDPWWNTYNNLTPAQIAAFQGMPQDLTNYALQRCLQAQYSGGPVQQLYALFLQHHAAINTAVPTITSRKQIDAAIAALAPNSLSAAAPSAT